MLLGLVALFSLKGGGARRVKMMFGYGLILSLGGCVGALGWLGVETSGHRNIFHAAHPLIWVGCFGIGVAVLLVASFSAMSLRAQEKKNPTS